MIYKVLFKHYKFKIPSKVFKNKILNKKLITLYKINNNLNKINLKPLKNNFQLKNKIQKVKNNLLENKQDQSKIHLDNLVLNH